MLTIGEVLTIGYEGSTIAAVTAALQSAGARLLIDVRAVPQSRKPGFSRRQLQAAMEVAGIGYVHLQPLGMPKPGRDAVRAGHPEAMRRIYRDHMAGDAPQAALAEARMLAGGTRACLLCFEHDPAHCHRTLVAEMIVAAMGQNIRHLVPAGDSPIAKASSANKCVSTPTKMPRKTKAWDPFDTAHRAGNCRTGTKEM